MALRQVVARSSFRVKVSAVFAGAALLLAPVMLTCSSTRDSPKKIEEQPPAVYTNGTTTITMDNGRVKVESLEGDTHWSMEAKVRGVREIGRIRMLTVDLGNAEMSGINNPMRGTMPADALTANNMLDAGAPEDKASFIIVPNLGDGPRAKVRDAHELTHALLFEYYGAGGRRLPDMAEEAIANAAQIAYGDARAGFEDVLVKVSRRDRRLAARVATELLEDFAASMKMDPRKASDAQLRDVALAFLDKLCRYRFQAPFASVVDTSAYSGL